MTKAQIVYYATGRGLALDADIVKAALEKAGFSVDISRRERRQFSSQFLWLRSKMWDKFVRQKIKQWFVQYFLFFLKLLRKPQYDVVIFLERIHWPSLSAAPVSVLIPNQEWYPGRERYLIHQLDAVFCKTQAAVSAFNAFKPRKLFIGFESQDKKLPQAHKNYRQFIHVAGRSRQKGTRALVHLWSKHPEWPQLKVVFRYQENLPRAANIQLIADYLTDEDLIRMQNESGIHICTSEVEGFGHTLVEAMGLSAVVVTTDAPPMHELVTPDLGYLVPFKASRKMNLGTAFVVDDAHLEKVVQQIIDESEEALREKGERARARFKTMSMEFQMRLQEALAEVMSVSYSESRKGI